MYSQQLLCTYRGRSSWKERTAVARPSPWGPPAIWEPLISHVKSWQVMLEYLAYGPVAQGIEHRFPKPGVDGSNPPGVTIRQRTQRYCCPWVFSSPHGETHSGCGTSRKGTLCALDLTEKHALQLPPGRDVTKRRALHVTRRYRYPHRCCRQCRPRYYRQCPAT